MTDHRVLPIDQPLTAEELADHLRRMRAHAGLSVREAALRVGLTPNAVGAHERGLNLKQALAVLHLFESYGCTVKILPPIKRSTSGVWSGAARKPTAP